MVKKRYFRSFLAIVVSIFALPIMVNATVYVLPEASDNVITLTEDVELDTYITVAEGESLTIDLNGYSLTTTYVYDYGSLTIKDSGSTGSLNMSVSGATILVEGVNATFTLESGTINNTTYYGVYSKSGGIVTINGGSINSLESCLSGNNTTEENVFVVNGGTLTATNGAAIYMPGQGTLTITGGTLYGGLSVRMGTVNISGGTIYATTGDIDSYAYYYGYSGNAWFGDAIYAWVGAYTSETGDNSLTLNITDGAFISENGSGTALTVYDLGKVEQDITINISGGTFTTNASSVSAYQIIEYADFTPTKTYTGDWGTYSGNVSTTITGGAFSTDVDLDYVPGTYVVNEYSTYYIVDAQAVEATVEEIDTSQTVTEVTIGVTSTEDLDEMFSDSLASSDLETDNINVSISIEMETIDEMDTDVDAFTSIGSVVSSLSSDAVVAGYFDITINVTNADTGDSIGTLTNLSSAISFTALLPEDLQEVADGYTRTYYVVRYHEGSAELIETTLSDDGTYITFETDKFSTYALAYVDAETTSQTTTTDNPQTGDNWFVYIILGVVAAGGLVYLTTMDNKKKKSK